MKYLIQFTETRFISKVVEAESQEDAKNKFTNGDFYLPESEHEFRNLESDLIFIVEDTTKPTDKLSLDAYTSLFRSHHDFLRSYGFNDSSWCNDMCASYDIYNDEKSIESFKLWINQDKIEDRESIEDSSDYKSPENMKYSLYRGDHELLMNSNYFSDITKAIIENVPRG